DDAAGLFRRPRLADLGFFSPVTAGAFGCGGAAGARADSLGGAAFTSTGAASARLSFAGALSTESLSVERLAAVSLRRAALLLRVLALAALVRFDGAEGSGADLLGRALSMPLRSAGAPCSTASVSRTALSSAGGAAALCVRRFA
ncbi:MAG: hypothetical protein ACYS7M_07355, partial [Planctomycetota bacterium]